jgi:UDP-GlcNAc:undecaprenyl-phosphate GlcNAc-1-phosphate transferase
MDLSLFNLAVIALAFALAVLLTAAVRALARRWGVVAPPKADRWHKEPTALLGGVAIFVTVTVVYLALMPYTAQTLVILGGSTFLWLVGLVDDLLHLKPYQKLIGQLMGTAILLAFGLTLSWTPSPAVNVALTIFWMVGITNAINLLDNMDGLAAGIAAIAAIFLGSHFAFNEQPAEALVLIVFAAALGGFLVFNTNPASIFMGDCGSMFIGFFLAGVALLSTSTGGRSRSLLPVLAVPVLTLFIPIFDTAFVTVLRKMAGRSPSRGGRDHTSHRLVALGLSERKAVRLLYGLATLSGLLASLVREAPVDVSLVSVILFIVVLTFLGVHLAGVKVYSEDELRTAREKPLVAFLIDLSYKRRIFEVFLDVVLIVLAFQVSSTLLAREPADSSAWGQLLTIGPVLVLIKLPVFLVLGVYRGLWRYVGMHDLVVYVKAVTVGSAISALFIFYVLHWQVASPSVFLLDGLILFVLLAGTRLLFRLLRSLLPPTPGPFVGRRVLIYGAGDGGELLLREMSNNRELQYTPVGFLDDDPLKKDRMIHGLRVHGGNGSLLQICRQHRAEEVIISSTRFTEDRVRELAQTCAGAGITLRRLRIQLDPVILPDTEVGGSC